MSDSKLANPAALGLGGFAMTTFLLNFVNAGIVDAASLGMVLPVGLFYGGMAQFCAGMWEVKSGNTFGATCFSSFGAFWIALATMIILETAGLLPAVPVEGMTLFLVAWGIFTGYATIASLKTSRALCAVFVTLTILFFLLAWGEYNATVKTIAGYEGILCALIAWYCSAAVLINSTFGRELLPLGHLSEQIRNAPQPEAGGHFVLSLALHKLTPSI
ncbi:MAG: acetate uptake transporter [Dehalococcoidia bacterium]